MGHDRFAAAAIAPETPRGRETVDQLRMIVRLVESAEVMLQRARHTRDAAQAAVLRRRAERRMRDAAQLRAQLPARSLRAGAGSRRRMVFRVAEFQK